MLVLTRRPNEQLWIGNHEISVTVLEIRGGRVRLGITAPPHVKVLRQEVVVDVAPEALPEERELVCGAAS